MSRIRSAVLTQYRRVTDSRTQTQTYKRQRLIFNILAIAQRRAGENGSCVTNAGRKRTTDVTDETDDLQYTFADTHTHAHKQHKHHPEGLQQLTPTTKHSSL